MHLELNEMMYSWFCIESLIGETQFSHHVYSYINPLDQVRKSGKPDGSSFIDLALASNRETLEGNENGIVERHT